MIVGVQTDPPQPTETRSIKVQTREVWQPTSTPEASENDETDDDQADENDKTYEPNESDESLDLL